MDSGRDTLAGGFPHSEISGSKLGCQLPGAFRRLSRLSSPVVAKASTVCACSLDPITRNPVDGIQGLRSGRALYVTLPRAITRARSLRTFHIVKEQSRLEPRSKRRRPEPIPNAIALHGTCKNNNQSINNHRFGTHRRWSWISVRGRAGWWSQAGSNRRPPACKAGALPAELWPHGLVGLGGLEPPTSPLSGVRSNRLSYRPALGWRQVVGGGARGPGERFGKGGDPAAGSPTATLLRLHPSH